MGSPGTIREREPIAFEFSMHRVPEGAESTVIIVDHGAHQTGRVRLRPGLDPREHDVEGLGRGRRSL